MRRNIDKGQEGLESKKTDNTNDYSENDLQLCRKVIEIFKKILSPPFPYPLQITDERIIKVRQRNEDLMRINMTFEEFFEKVKSSPFLCDHANSLSFDWQMKQENFNKIIDGNYNRTQNEKKQSQQSFKELPPRDSYKANFLPGYVYTESEESNEG